MLGEEEGMEVRSLKLYDVRYGKQWDEEVHYGWNYDDFLKDERWRTGCISFDCLLWDKETDEIHVGVTSFNEKDISYKYDRKAQKFVYTGIGDITDFWDAKFHRSLVKREKDGCYYAAIALLHCVDHYLDAPGGAICRYDPKTGRWEKLCIPVPHTYIQNIVLDEENDFLYCMTFAPEYMLRYHIPSGEIKNYGLIGSGIAGMAQGESCALDDEGTLWGTWKITRAWSHDVGENASRLFKIRAGADKIEFLQHGLPKVDGSFGYEKPECFFNLEDGYIYASAANGSLYRIDIHTNEATYLFTPISDRRSRLAALAVGPDGYAYGVTGRDGDCRLLRFDFRNTKYELLGKVVDQEGEPCWQIHHVVITDDGVLYAGENDIPHRSGYLWEIKLP